MGLDITLYRVKSAIGIPSIIKHKDIDEWNDFSFFNDADDVCETIKHNSKPVIVEKSELDVDKLRAIYPIDDKIKDEQIFVAPASIKSSETKVFEIVANVLQSPNKPLLMLNEEEYKNVSFLTRKRFYVSKLTRVAYQRGIPEDGDAYLPENCVLCDDKNRVETLVDHGLDKSFLEAWEDDCTVLEAWW